VITVGSRVGGYTVIRLLGQGGMGQVYLAQHQRIARRVAVKVLLPELSANGSVIDRFFTEARATSLIRHPGIVEVLDCDVLDGQAFIVMEYLEGESLAGYLARTGGLTGDPAFALAVVGQVAVAVGAAHATGIVHRDLKPDNIFLCVTARDARVVPKVLDFGIAKVALRGEASQTRTGAVIGTPTYMSPEQCRGGSKAVDGRSDVYSLGCILYETLCGRPPFVRDGMGELIVAHVAEPPDDPRSLVPDLSPALAGLVMRMLAKAPDARPPTMESVSREIIRGAEMLGLRGTLADILPRRPVILPAADSAAPSLPSPAPLSASPPAAGAPSSQTADAPPSPSSSSSSSSGGSWNERAAMAGGTRVMARGAPASVPPAGGEAGRSIGPTTLRGSVVERAAEDSGRSVRSSAARWMIPVAAVAAIGGLAIAFAVSRSGDPPAAAPAVAVPEIERPPAAVVPPPAPPAPVPAGAPEIVTIDLRGLPASAEILLDGAPASGAPLKLKRDDRRHLIVVRADGYYDRTLEIGADRDQVVAATLTAASRTEKPRPHGTARRSAYRQQPKASPGPSAVASAPSPSPPRASDGATTLKPAPSGGQKKSSYDDM